MLRIHVPHIVPHAPGPSKQASFGPSWNGERNRQGQLQRRCLGQSCQLYSWLLGSLTFWHASPEGGPPTAEREVPRFGCLHVDEMASDQYDDYKEGDNAEDDAHYDSVVQLFPSLVFLHGLHIPWGVPA